DVLLDYRIERATTFRDIAPQTANETDIVRSVDENFYIHLLQQTRFSKNQDAFNDHDRLGRYRCRVRQTRVRAKVINGKFYRLAGIQLFEMINQQLVIDGVGMIEVRRVAIVQRHVFQIAVIKILLNEDDFVGAYGFEDPIRYRCLA